MNRPFTVLVYVCSIAAATFSLGACKKSEPTPAPKPPAPAAGASHDGHDHGAADGHSHDVESSDGHGATVELGSQSVSGFAVKASRDGDVKAGGDAPIDVWITGGAAKIAAVRFWIGVEDASGSVKAKADLEKDNWHTHAEVPEPIPAGSKLWVEFETEASAGAAAGKHVASFDLKL